MIKRCALFFSLCLVLIPCVAHAGVPSPIIARGKPFVTPGDAQINGVKIHYLKSGEGPPVILIHGFAQTSHMWLPLIEQLALTHTVIAPDLRGYGDSDKPETGYDKKTLAQDIHALAQSLGIKKADIVGHDIGLMVAYAYAAQYTPEVGKIVLMDAFLPGVGDWKSVWLMRDLWHFHFYGKTPLALVTGRERTYLDHFYDDFAANPQHSVPEGDRNYYANVYAQPGAMAAGMATFKAFEQDADDFGVFSKAKISNPMLVLTGEKASGQFLIDQANMVDDAVAGVIVPGAGHWLINEAPDQVIPKIVDFLKTE